MITRIARLVLVVALIATTGTHWVLLQSVAWTTMFVSHLKDGSVTDTLTRTFDGKHPCRLCHAIESGKKSEKQSECVIVLKKFEMINPATVFVFSPSSRFTLLPQRQETYSSFQPSPPVPPPRVA